MTAAAILVWVMALFGVACVGYAITWAVMRRRQRHNPSGVMFYVTSDDPDTVQWVGEDADIQTVKDRLARDPDYLRNFRHPGDQP